jgi:hypothetical protein
MRYIIVLLSITFSVKSIAQQSSLPSWFTTEFRQLKLGDKYAIKGYIKPAFLQADFNGDGIKDVAVLAIEKKTGKKGIVVILGGTFKYFVFGAGTEVGKAGFDGSDDLKWMEKWGTYKQKIAYETKFDNGDMVGTTKRKLINKGIEMWSLEDGDLWLAE